MSIKTQITGFLLAIILVYSLNQGYCQNAPITTIGTTQPCPGTSVLIPVTVSNFSNIGSLTLRIEYDPTVLSYQSSININPGLSGIVIHDYPISATLHKVTAIWFNTIPLSLPNATKLFDLSFTYVNGSTTLAFNNTSNNGIDCEYSDQAGNPLNDLPTGTYYSNGNVSTKQVPAAGSVLGTTSVCQGQNNVSYSISPLQNATGYVWSVPVGATVISGSGTNSIFVNFANNASSGAVSVYGTNICGNGTPSPDLMVTVNSIPGDPGPITGSSALCAGQSGVIYSVPAIPSATGYIWTVPPGALIISGDNTQAITVNFGPSANSGNVTVHGTNNCGNSPSTTTFPVTVNPIQQVSLNITASENPVCIGTNVTFTASATNGGSSPSFQWKVNGQNVGVNSPSYSYPPSNNDIVTCILTSNISCPGGNPATSNSIIMGVIENSPVSLTIVSSGNTVCAGASVSFTATPVNGGSSPVHQWKVNGSNVGTNSPNYSYIPANNDIVTCVLTSNAICATGSPATSNAITMGVNPNLPVSVMIVELQNNVCSGTSVTFTATPTNPGSAPVYQWKVNGSNVGTNSSQYSYAPLNNDAVSCVLTSSATCPQGNPATSNTVTMVVNPILPVSVSITASSNPVCNGTLVAFTASPNNGGSSPSYQWKVNGANQFTGSPVFTYIPADGDQITCVLTSNAICATGSPATSNAVTMVVNSNIPVSVSIAASSNPACSGNQVTFTATPTNGGSVPTYQWKVNGANAGTSNPVFSYVPANNDLVTCLLTSDITCASGNPALSNPITMTVNPNLPVSIAISASANSVCAGTSVTFTASAINPGISPVYQWKVNGNNAGSNSTTFAYVPSNNDIVTCTLTSSVACPVGNPAVSNQVEMVVYPVLPVSITIAALGNPVCFGTSVTFTATPTNGGSSPVYQWKVNGSNAGTNSPNYSYIPANNDIVTCVITSDATCATGSPATSNAISMLVNPNLPVSVTIVESANNVCSGTSVTFTATPTNPGSAPVYQWKINGNNVGTNSNQYSYTPSNNDAVTCVMTSNATCPQGNPATSNTVTMVVNPILPVSVSITASSNPVCNGTLVTFTASPANGGSSPSYQWKVNGTNQFTGSPVFTYTPADGDQIICVLTSNATCATGSPATSNAVTMVVNSNIPVSVSIAASSNPACSGNQVTFTATPTNGGSAPTYQWKVNGMNAGTNNPVFSYMPANNDQVSCLLTSDITCASGNPALSNPITMTVNPNLPVSVAISASANSVCASTSVTFTASATNAGTSPVYQWKVNGNNVGSNSTNFAFVPSNNDLVTCALTSSVACPVGNPVVSNQIDMVVYPILPVSLTIAASGNPVCSGTSMTFTATPTNGGSTPMYQWKVNGSNAGTNSPNYSYIPANNDIVTCILTSNATCATGSPATSNAITMEVNPTPVPTITGLNSICNGSAGVSYATESGMTNYQWTISSGGTITSGAGSNQIFVSWNNAGAQSISVQYINNAGCSSAGPVSMPITVTPITTPTISGPTSATPGSSGITYSTEPGMTNYTWSISSGGTISSGQGTSSVEVSWNTVGTAWIQVNYINQYGCISSTPTVLNVMVNSIPQPTISGSVNVCLNTENVIYFTETGQTNYVWIVSSGGTIIYGGGPFDSFIMITWNNPGNQSVSVNYTNSYGSTAPTPTVLQVNVQSPPQSSVTGDASPCSGSGPYVYLTEPGMYNYNWTVSAGGTIMAGGTTFDHSVTINWNGTGAQTVGVGYTNEIGCLSIPANLPVNLHSGTVPTILGPTELCAGTESATYMTEPDMTGYAWSVSSGGTITGNPNSNAITIDWNTAGAQYVTVNYVNSYGCQVPNPTIQNISVNPLPVPQINGPSVVSTDTSSVIYSTQSGQVLYNWQVSSGGIITAGGLSTDPTVSVRWLTPGAQWVSVNFNNEYGCTSVAPVLFNVTVNQTFSLSLQNINIIPGQDTCFNALQAILVGGLGSYFTVQNGGSSTLIAGQSIQLLPGTTVHNGGYLHGYISTNGCGFQAPAIPDKIAGNEYQQPNSGEIPCKIFPNPTNGKVLIEFPGNLTEKAVSVVCYDLMGIQIFEKEYRTGGIYEIDLSGQKPGIYIYRIFNNGSTFVKKILKY